MGPVLSAMLRTEVATLRAVGVEDPAAVHHVRADDGQHGCNRRRRERPTTSRKNMAAGPASWAGSRPASPYELAASHDVICQTLPTPLWRPMENVPDTRSSRAASV